MTNWTDIHPDFAKEWLYGKTYQAAWEKWGLTYQEADEWIGLGFRPDYYWEVEQWKRYNFTSQHVKFWKDVGLSKRDYEFAAYLRWKGYQSQLNLNLRRLRENWKNLSAQDYLDCFYPQEQRKTIKELGISSKNLESNLDLNDFINLEELNCSQNKLTALKINNCLQLRKLDCNNNCLQDLVLPFESEKLTELDVRNNNFSERDLSMFSHLVNLKYLGVGNSTESYWPNFQSVYWSDEFKNKIQEGINQGIYNRFVGSLEPLWDLKKLGWLDISNTDAE